MNRLIIFTILLSFGSSTFAQEPDPNLFRTWYLSFVQSSDEGFPYEVSEIDPPINPYITILENLDFNGEGACNSFNGTYSLPFPDILESITFTRTMDDCGIQVHNSFENSYFGFMQGGGWFEITPDGEGLILSISNPIFGSAIFRDYILSSSDFNLNEIKIYPNPGSSRIFIESKTNLVTKIELYSLLGENIQTLNYNIESIDISDLTSGIYLLKIYIENGSTVKKIIKK